jgi:hypothetical protein
MFSPILSDALDIPKTIGAENYALSSFQQLELLQSGSDQKEWNLLDDSLSIPYYLEASFWR